MKTRIFNRGNGWYISATNYKDPNDKSYMNLYFVSNTDPVFKPSGSDWTFLDINVLEGKYTSYKGKIGLTVFKYEIIKEESNGLQEIDPIERNASRQDVEISPDDLPFY